MGNLQKVVYLSESQAQELFTNETITVDGVTVNYSADDLYLTPDNSGDFVLKTGDTMTGALILSADPTTNLGAATKQYVDTAVAGGGSNYVLKTGDTMTGDLSITGESAPAYYMRSSDGTPIGVLYSLTSSGRVVLRGYNSDATHYNGFLIPDTSNVTANADYDILTSKTPVTIAQGGTNATTAADALTNLGAVAKSGDTMTGALLIQQANNYPTIGMLRADGTRGVWIQPSLTSDARLGVLQYNTGGTYYERYLFPTLSSNLTANMDYALLTSKSPVTVAQGGTNATDAATARTNLGLGSLATKSSLIASDIPALSYLPISGGTLTGVLTTPSSHVYDSSLPTILFKSSSTASTYSALLRSRISDSLFYISVRQSGNSYGENYKLPLPTSTADVSYNIITDKNITQTLPGQLILSKTTDVNASASSECALVIGTKTGEHLALDTNEIMAKASATTVGPLNLNYNGGNIVMGTTDTSYYVQIRSTAGATSATTGALRVGGGIGVGGAIYASGLVEGAELRTHGSSWPCIQFTNTIAGSTLGQIHLTVSSRIMTFREVTTSGSTIYEDFSLPAPTITSGTQSYNILTTKQTVTTATAASGVTITSGGGVIKLGRVCIVNMQIVTSASKSNSTALITGLPTPLNDVVITALNGTTFYTSRIVSGSLYPNVTWAAGTYNLNGAYFTA